MQYIDATPVSFPITHSPTAVEAATNMQGRAAPHGPRGFGWRMLSRFKVVNGKRYQLHATRGWKCIGRVKK